VATKVVILGSPPTSEAVFHPRRPRVAVVAEIIMRNLFGRSQIVFCARQYEPVSHEVGGINEELLQA
jgi:hypothetical protein